MLVNRETLIYTLMSVCDHLQSLGKKTMKTTIYIFLVWFFFFSDKFFCLKLELDCPIDLGIWTLIYIIELPTGAFLSNYVLFYRGYFKRSGGSWRAYGENQQEK